MSNSAQRDAVFALATVMRNHYPNSSATQLTASPALQRQERGPREEREPPSAVTRQKTRAGRQSRTFKRRGRRRAAVGPAWSPRRTPRRERKAIRRLPFILRRGHLCFSASDPEGTSNQNVCLPPSLRCAEESLRSADGGGFRGGRGAFGLTGACIFTNQSARCDETSALSPRGADESAT